LPKDISTVPSRKLRKCELKMDKISASMSSDRPGQADEKED